MRPKSALSVRKQTLASLLRGSPPGVQFNQHLADRGDVVFEHACKMGLGGIVSKRLGSRYRSGRTSDWLKFKNPAAPAVQRGHLADLINTMHLKDRLADIETEYRN